MKQKSVLALKKNIATPKNSCSQQCVVRNPMCENTREEIPLCKLTTKSTGLTMCYANNCKIKDNQRLIDQNYLSAIEYDYFTLIYIYLYIYTYFFLMLIKIFPGEQGI